MVLIYILICIIKYEFEAAIKRLATVMQSIKSIEKQ